MPDALFAHPRLAAIYDLFENGRTDLDAYVRLVAELGAHDVLDVGCGTGTLARRLAQDGYEVTGIDPAEASLDVARRQPGAERVVWIHGDAMTLPPLRVDLAVMTGNVAQVFLDDAEWTSTLRAIRAALRDEGHFVFETRRSNDRAWERWIVDPDSAVRDSAVAGKVEQRREVTAVELPFVSFRYTYRFASDGLVLQSDSTLRFRNQDEVERSLVTNGFRVLEIRQSPDRPGQEFVFLAQPMP